MGKTCRTSHSIYVDKAISKGISLKFSITEPLLLRINRRKFQREYINKSEEQLISLIIATYNRGKILAERTIPSILSQTYRNFEIIVVGDHCIDNTAELILSINDPRVRFFDLPKRGEYPPDPKNRWFVQGVAPRNKGLEMAKGKWLAWISDDDILLPNHFESMLRFAQSGNYEFVSASYTFEKNGKIQIQDASSFNPRIGGMQTWLYRSYLKFFRWNINSWRKDWDRPCDYDLQYRMYRAGVRMGFLNEVVAHIPPVEGTDTIGLEAQMALAQK